MKTDAELRADIEAIAHHQACKAVDDLSVEVKQGIVLFGGKLASHAQKRALERAVLCLPGVKGAIFETQIEVNEDTRANDLRIARAVDEALRALPGGVAHDIRPTVEQGWVTLRGVVPWGFERQAAERAVLGIPDVQGVTDAIDLHPTALAGDVTRNIDEALVQQAHREGRSIMVDVDGSTVTLRGCVRSSAEREAAGHAALYSSGVDEVVNALVVRA